MPFTLALPVALSAIQSLIKFRGRLDTILSLNQTTVGLPFALPPVPANDGPHIDPMRAFFGTETGRDILIIRGLETDWAALSPDPRAGSVQASLGRLLKAYYESCDIRPESLGPNEETNRAFVAKGPSKELRLAYYVVESDRLSRNPAVTRVLLAAADTLLEFGADNAGLFVANPRTRALVESLLTEFAVKRDWDDAGGAQIFKTLLGSAAVAALENPGAVPDKPVLKVLFRALGDVQQSLGADFVAQLVTREGFQALISRCLVRSADEPSLLPDTPVLQEALGAMLREAGENLDSLLGDPGALAGVLEAGLSAAATAAIPLVDRKVAGEPLLAVVLKSTLDRTQKAAAANQLFGRIADGGFFAALYAATLQGVAANPAALASLAKLDAHVAKLIATLAGELAAIAPGRTPSTETLRALAVRALEVVAQEPEFLGAQSEFAAKVIGAALASAAQALTSGFTRDDLVAITETVVRTAATNLNLVELDDRLRGVLAALGQTLADEGLARVTTAAGRKALFVAGLEALAINPRVWRGLAEKDLVQPLVLGVIRAFATNPVGLLSGPALVPAFAATLVAAAQRGRALLDKRTTPDALGNVLTAALATAEKAIGDSIDGKTLPEYLRRVVLAFLATPFDPAAQSALDDWLLQKLPVAA